MQRPAGSGWRVQSRYFSVGSVVPWAEPGVAVATQSFTEVSYGPRGLQLMRAGASALEALESLLAGDDGSDLRQVAMVDANGSVAVHTGARCVEAAGHAVGDGVSAQANMMERDTVWAAMLDVFGDADGEFPDRLLAALRAAEAEGGDIRGRQSAALLVVEADPSVPPWRREIDLRVEDHADPLAELERLLRLARAYQHAGSGNDHATAGRMEEAVAEMEQAHALAPEDDQIAFMLGLMLPTTGHPMEARELVERARAANPRWAPYLRRLAASGIFPNDPALMDALFPLDPGAAP